MKANLVKDAKNNFHYTKVATTLTPKGTLMLHYALSGTKEELDAYEEAKGEDFFSTVDGGTHDGKPIWFTSRTKLGEELEVAMNKDGFVNPVETLETAITKSEDKKLNIALDKGNKRAEIELKAQMCAKYGVNMS